MAALLLVHAHPDDEAVSTGGVMMKAKSHGHRVVLITATRGEVGEIYNMDEEASRPRLGEIRSEELKSAAEILGVDRLEFLGYRDSGMVDTADNKDPRSFHQARLEDAAGKLAVFVREERPDVVVTYAEDGVYGHPDHIKAHFVTNATLDVVEREGSPVPKLYYTAIPRSTTSSVALVTKCALIWSGCPYTPSSAYVTTTSGRSSRTKTASLPAASSSLAWWNERGSLLSAVSTMPESR